MAGTTYAVEFTVRGMRGWFRLARKSGREVRTRDGNPSRVAHAFNHLLPFGATKLRLVPAKEGAQ